MKIYKVKVFFNKVLIYSEPVKVSRINVENQKYKINYKEKGRAE